MLEQLRERLREVAEDPGQALAWGWVVVWLWSWLRGLWKRRSESETTPAEAAAPEAAAPQRASRPAHVPRAPVLVRRARVAAPQSDAHEGGVIEPRPAAKRRAPQASSRGSRTPRVAPQSLHAAMRDPRVLRRAIAVGAAFEPARASLRRAR